LVWRRLDPVSRGGTSGIAMGIATLSRDYCCAIVCFSFLDLFDTPSISS
jgi:hypothetical protein